jgi:hypothetical protein
MIDEKKISEMIEAKGMTAPKLSPAQIDAKIENAAYYVFPGTTLTVCALTLSNGFIATGTSAAASPENFDEEIGRTIAFKNAREKIWELEGYLLREKLAFKKLATLPTVMVPAHDGMGQFVGTKIVNATPMDRKAYIALRGWELPADENPDDPGYLVEYTDKVQHNVDGYDGYVTWSPADTFENAYRLVDGAPAPAESMGDGVTITGPAHDEPPAFSS